MHTGPMMVACQWKTKCASENKWQNKSGTYDQLHSMVQHYKQKVGPGECHVTPEQIRRLKKINGKRLGEKEVCNNVTLLIRLRAMVYFGESWPCRQGVIILVVFCPKSKMS